MKTFYLTILLVLFNQCNSSILMKTLDNPIVPESNKLQIMLQANGQPVAIATKNKITHAYADRNVLKITPQKNNVANFDSTTGSKVTLAKTIAKEHQSEFSKKPQNVNKKYGMSRNRELGNRPNVTFNINRRYKLKGAVKRLGKAVRLSRSIPNYRKQRLLPQYHDLDMNNGVIHNHTDLGHEDPRIITRPLPYNPVFASNTTHNKSQIQYNRGFHSNYPYNSGITYNKYNKHEIQYNNPPIDFFNDSHAIEHASREHEALSPEEQTHNLQKYAIQDIYTDLEVALDKGNMEAPISVSPQVLQEILTHLKKIENNPTVLETDTNSLETENYIDYKTNLRKKIEELESEKSRLMDEIQNLKSSGGSFNNIQAVETQEQNIEAQEQKILLNASSQVDTEVKSEIEHLDDEMYKLALTGASDEQKADIEEQIGDLQVKDAELQEETKIIMVDDYNTAIDKMEHEEKVLEHNNTNPEELIKVQTEINQLETEKQKLIEDTKITDAINEEIKANEELVNQLSPVEGHIEQIEALRRSKRKLIDEENLIKTIDTQLLSDNSSNTDLTSQSLEAKILTIESAAATIEREDNDRTSNNDSNHKTLQVLSSSVKFYIDNFNVIYSPLPASLNDLPEYLPENTNELVKLYQKLSVFIDLFDHHKEKLNTYISLIQNHIKVVQLDKKGILTYYGLNNRYNDIKGSAKNTNFSFIIKDNEIIIETDIIAEKFKSLLKNMESLKAYNDYIEENLPELRLSFADDNRLNLEQENKLAFKTAHELLKTKDYVAIILKESTIIIDEVDNKSSQLNNLIDDLEKIGNNVFYIRGKEPIVLQSTTAALQSYNMDRHKGETDSIGITIVAKRLCVLLMIKYWV